MNGLKNFISEAPIAAAMFDLEMRYIAYSPRWLTDHRIDHIALGDSHYSVFPEIPDRWREVHRRALGGETLRETADRFERAHGVVVWLNWEVRPWRDGSGAVAGVVIFTEDVTDRVAAETALREASQRKSEFVAMLAHELRNPLTPISNALHALDRMEGAQDGKRKTLLEMALRQVDYLVRLTDDLLDVARVEHGKIRIEKKPVELAGVIDRAVELCRSALVSKRQRLDVSVATKLVIAGDPVRLTQIFANLIDNASRYSGEESRIDVRATAEGAEVLVSVKDQGVGIPAEMLASIFDLFTQDRERTPRSGLGVGLALAQRLVVAHGGEITAQSDGPGRGSEFVVRLPLAER